jgi:hypothetical protein
MGLVAPEGAADEAVGIAKPDHQGTVEGCPAPHLATCVIRRNARRSISDEVGLPELVVMGIEEFAAVGMDDLEIVPRANAQASRLDAARDLGGTPDQYRAGDALVANDLHRAQHPLVLALGEDDALGCCLGLREHRLHDQAGVIDEFVQPADRRPNP